jgi:hypothetical protein
VHKDLQDQPVIKVFRVIHHKVPKVVRVPNNQEHQDLLVHHHKELKVIKV